MPRPTKPILSLLLLFFVSLFFSCKKEEPIAPPSPPPAPEMTAQIDGNNWKADTMTVRMLEGTMHIRGRSQNGEILAFTLTNDQPIFYPLDSADNTQLGAYTMDPKIEAYVTNISTENAGGFLEISEINEQDSTITGNFEMIVVRRSDSTAVNITEGHFSNLKYTGNNSDFLFCLIDDRMHFPVSIAVLRSSGTLSMTARAAKEPGGPEYEEYVRLGIGSATDAKPGVFTLNVSDADNRAGATYCCGNSLTETPSGFLAFSGTLRLNRYDRTDPTKPLIEGSFDFSAGSTMGTYRTVEITGGVFGVQDNRR